MTETVKIYLGKSLNEFKTSLQLVGMSEIQVRKSLLRLYFSWYLPARTECNYKTESFFVIMCKTKSFREKLLCAIVSTFLFFMFVDQLLLVDANLWQKTRMADFRYISLKSWKLIISIWHSNLVYDFHRLPLSIDKNHLIATNFYRLTTPRVYHTCKYIEFLCVA